MLNFLGETLKSATFDVLYRNLSQDGAFLLFFGSMLFLTLLSLYNSRGEMSAVAVITGVVVIEVLLFLADGISDDLIFLATKAAIFVIIGVFLAFAFADKGHSSIVVALIAFTFTLLLNASIIETNFSYVFAAGMITSGLVFALLAWAGAFLGSKLR